jgi:hypothetical protein
LSAQRQAIQSIEPCAKSSVLARGVKVVLPSMQSRLRRVEAVLCAPSEAPRTLSRCNFSAQSHGYFFFEAR